VTVVDHWVWLAVWLVATVMLLGLVRRGWVTRLLSSGPPPLAALIALVAIVTGFSLLARPTGDEPHYLIMSQSLLGEGDLDLRDNYQRLDYLDYYDYVIPDPHVTYDADGWHPIHNFGLPVLMTPAFAVGGRPAVVLLIAITSAAGVRVVWSLLRRAGVSYRAAGIATMTAAFTLPFASMAGQIYPEVPAVLLVSVALWAILAPSMKQRDLIGLIVVLAILPWLHLKYTALSVGLLVAATMIHRRREMLPKVALGAFVIIASVTALVVTSRWLFNIPVPGLGAVVPQGPGGITWQGLIGAHFLASPLVGMAGVLFDQQSGILLASPIFALALPGLLSRRKGPWLPLAMAVVFFSVYLPAGLWGVWHAEGSSPARFLLPVVPVLALGLAGVLEFPTLLSRRLFVILAVPSLVHAYLMATLPSFVRYGDPATHHNYFVALAERVTRWDLTPLFPSFRDVTAMTWISALIYTAAILVMTIVLLRGGPRPALRQRMSDVPGEVQP